MIHSYQPPGISADGDTRELGFTKRCWTIYIASESVDARKKTHVKQTRWNVAKVLIAFTTCVGSVRGRRREKFRLFHKAETTIKMPCNAPQIRNVQSVPCQRPLASIVNMGGSPTARMPLEPSLLRLSKRLS